MRLVLEQRPPETKKSQQRAAGRVLGERRHDILSATDVVEAKGILGDKKMCLQLGPLRNPCLGRVLQM